LDLIDAAFTTTLKTNYDAAYSALHSHSNKTTLDLIDVAFTSALKTAYDGAVTDKHTHLNKTTLDLIDVAFTSTLKTTYDGYATTISGKEPTIAPGSTSQYWRGDKSWQTLNATAVGLGNVTNESKATMFTSPSFTGDATFSGHILSGADNAKDLGQAGTGFRTGYFVTSVRTKQLNLMSPTSAGTGYIIFGDADGTFNGRMVIQAGGGSAGYGGAINLYGHSHATKSGDVAIGLSASATSRKFRINNSGLDAGTDIFTIDGATGNATFSGVALHPNGSATSPSISFSGDTENNSGMYLLDQNEVGFSANGVMSFYYNTAKLLSSVPIYIPNGSASAPSLSFANDTNTGLYSVGADQIGFSTNGTLRATFSTSTLLMATSISMAGNYTYLVGNATTDGSWRMSATASGNCIVEYRSGGSWVAKQTLTP